MIQLKNVSFTYSRGENAGGVYDINLTVNAGETVLLCGESGCGKTTLTRLINGLIPNYYAGKLSGGVSVNGATVDQLPLYETGKLVGSVFQNPKSQFFNVDTTSELAFGCENRGIPKDEICCRVAETAKAFHIETLMDRSIFMLSGGEKQKIACASVSACRPDVLVLDEPSSNLDMAAVEDLRRLLGVWKSQGRTIVIAEHRLYYLREIADRVIYMKEGRIKREFTAAEFMKMERKALAALGLRPLYLETLEAGNKIPAEAADGVVMSDFRFSYKGVPDAVNISSVSIPRGGAAAIVGPNGAGKSTFARCLCGLNKRCGGRLRYAEQSYRGKGLLTCCYMVMQDVNHQLFAESVRDEVLLSMKEDDEEQASAILDRLDLLPMSEFHPMALSGGQKQRVAIAGAVAAEKKLVIFDEPTSGLDLRHMREVADVLRGLRETGKTLLVISHDLEFIMESCTYVLQMNQGKITDSYPLDAQGERKLKAAFLKPCAACL